jgi:hypothetical protein
VPIAKRYRDVSGGRLRLSGTGPPGLDGDDGEAGEQQYHAHGVQRFVEGERVVDGRCGAQVPRC